MGSTEEGDGSLIDNETPVTRSHYMPIRLMSLVVRSISSHMRENLASRPPMSDSGFLPKFSSSRTQSRMVQSVREYANHAALSSSMPRACIMCCALHFPDQCFQTNNLCRVRGHLPGRKILARTAICRTTLLRSQILAAYFHFILTQRSWHGAELVPVHAAMCHRPQRSCARACS
jgi:hypothetical protein